jgi:hypothetical protein
MAAGIRTGGAAHRRPESFAWDGAQDEFGTDPGLGTDVVQSVRADETTVPQAGGRETSESNAGGGNVVVHGFKFRCDA